MKGLCVSGAVLAAVFFALSAAAEEPSALVRLQTLEGRLVDAEARVAFAQRENERLSRELAELRRKATALEEASSGQN